MASFPGSTGLPWAQDAPPGRPVVVSSLRGPGEGSGHRDPPTDAVRNIWWGDAGVFPGLEFAFSLPVYFLNKHSVPPFRQLLCWCWVGEDPWLRAGGCSAAPPALLAPRVLAGVLCLLWGCVQQSPPHHVPSIVCFGLHAPAKRWLSAPGGSGLRPQVRTSDEAQTPEPGLVCGGGG